MLVMRELRQFGEIKKRLVKAGAVIIQVPKQTNLDDIINISGVLSVKEGQPT